MQQIVGRRLLRPIHRMIRLFIIFYLLLFLLLIQVDREAGKNSSSIRGNNSIKNRDQGFKRRRGKKKERKKKTMSTRKREAHGTDIIITIRYHHISISSRHLFLPLLMQIPVSMIMLVMMMVIPMRSRDLPNLLVHQHGARIERQTPVHEDNNNNSRSSIIRRNKSKSMNSRNT